MANTSERIGSVAKIEGNVNVRHADGSSEVLRPGASVFQHDILETGLDGRVGVVFLDKSTFSLGPRGRMALDEMVFDPGHPDAGHSTISALNGAFSFVSGQIAKNGPDAMQVKTPVMTIGIRGTTGAGIADQEGGMNTITLLRDGDGNLGQITISNAAGTITLNGETQTTQITSFTQPPSPPRMLSAAEVLNLFSAALAVQPLPPSNPPANPPPAPAPNQQGLDTAPPPPSTDQFNPLPPVLDTAINSGATPIQQVQVISILREISVWVANWTNVEQGKGIDLQQSVPETSVLADARDTSRDQVPVDTSGDNGNSSITTIVGGDGNDVLQGDDLANLLIGLSGDDTLYGNGGNDTLVPGSGFDSVYGGAGDDLIQVVKDGQFDTFIGGEGQDTLSYADETSDLHVTSWGTVTDGSKSDGFTGIETLILGSGFDTVVGSVGDDVIYGGAGGDSLIGNDGNDTLYGEAGNDTLQGGWGDDILYGGSGDDYLSGDGGADKVYGGDGDDTIALKNDTSNDTFDGGAGNDTLSFWDESMGVTVSLAGNTYTYIDDGQVLRTDTILNFENITGGTGDDTLTGNSGANVLNGGDGDDTLDGAAGDDFLYGGDGADSLIGGTGADTFTGGKGNDTLISQVDGSADVFRFVGAANMGDVYSQVASLGTDVIQGFESVDQIILGSSTFGLSAGALSSSQYVETASSPFGSLGSGSGVIAYYNSISGNTELWFSTDMSSASVSNSYQIATLSGTNLSTISEANISIQTD